MSSDDRQRGREPEGTLFPAAAGAGLISVVRELAGTPKRVSVLVGRRRAAVLLSTQAMEMGLAPGVAWTEEVAARAARLERVNAAKAMAMRRLAARARSRAEMAAWLESKGVDEGIAAEAVERLVEVGLIRDEDVVADEIRRAEAKGLSGRAIAERLRERGVERGEGREGEAARLGDAERAIGVAKTVVGDELSRRGRETADVNVLARRVMGVLARKGYDEVAAREAVRAAFREHGLRLDEAE
jgi:regulatory protein